jgi:effector-binding domain-containing protein
MMTYDIQSRTVPTQPTAVVWASLPADDIAGWLPDVYQEVMTYLTDTGVTPAGAPFARLTFTGRTVDIEAGFPVPSPVSGRGRVVPSTLPGGTVAVTTHRGRYEELGVAHDAITGWLKEHGHEADGSPWEVYYTDPQTVPDPARWRTDVVAPYRYG